MRGLFSSWYSRAFLGLLCSTVAFAGYGQTATVTVFSATTNAPVNDASVTFRCLDGDQEGEEKTFATNAEGVVKNPFTCKARITIIHYSYNKLIDTLDVGANRTFYLEKSAAKISVDSEKDEKKEKWRIKKGYYVGPTAFVYFPSIDRGDASSVAGVGGRGQLVGKNKNIRYSAGLLFSSWKYQIGQIRVDSALSLAEQRGFPGIDNSLGVLQSIESRAFAIEIPLAIEYYFQVANQVNLFAGAGASPIVFLNQTFEYGYADILSGGPVTSEVSNSFPGIYLSANVKGGFEWRITDAMAYQTNLIYKLGVTDFGEESRGWDFFGVEATMYFTISRKAW